MSAFTADEHDTLIDAYATLSATGHTPTLDGLTHTSGLPMNVCETWINAGMTWNG